MVKKQTKKTQNKGREKAVSKRTSLVQKQYLLGNFYLARKNCRAMLQESDLDANETKTLREILVMSGIDTFAMGAGVLCFLFIIFITYLTAY